jgi:hypothetical protein
LITENNSLSEQFYKFKQRVHNGENAEPNNQSALDEKVHKDKMVELLKRNHDVMLEKYEIFRQRNEHLETQNLEREKLYTACRNENDALADAKHSTQRAVEDLKNQVAILEHKNATSTESLKRLQEQANALKLAKDRLEGQLAMSSD